MASEIEALKSLRMIKILPPPFPPPPPKKENRSVIRGSEFDLLELSITSIYYDDCRATTTLPLPFVLAALSLPFVLATTTALHHINGTTT